MLAASPRREIDRQIGTERKRERERGRGREERDAEEQTRYLRSPCVVAVAIVDVLKHRVLDVIYVIDVAAAHVHYDD